MIRLGFFHKMEEENDRAIKIGDKSWIFSFIVSNDFVDHLVQGELLLLLFSILSEVQSILTKVIANKIGLEWPVDHIWNIELLHGEISGKMKKIKSVNIRLSLSLVAKVTMSL